LNAPGVLQHVYNTMVNQVIIIKSLSRNMARRIFIRYHIVRQEAPCSDFHNVRYIIDCPPIPVGCIRTF